MGNKEVSGIKLLFIAFFSLIPFIVVLIYFMITAPSLEIATENNNITLLLKSLQKQLSVETEIKTRQGIHYNRERSQIRTKIYFFRVENTKEKLNGYVREINLYMLSQGFRRNYQKTDSYSKERAERIGYKKGRTQCITYATQYGTTISFTCFEE